MKGAAAFGAIAALIVLVVVALASLFTVDQTEQAIVLHSASRSRGAVSSPRQGFISNTPSSRMSFFSTIASSLSRRRDRKCLRPTITGSTSIPSCATGSSIRSNLSDGWLARTGEQSAGLHLELGGAAGAERGKHDPNRARQPRRSHGQDPRAGEPGRRPSRHRRRRCENRRADLPRQISEKVFSRMQSERAREAAQYRAQGSQLAQTITANADREVVVTLGNARREADQTRGAGDAERNRIFAEGFGRDPDFFAFYRSMQAYEAGLKGGDTRMVVSPKSDFFRFFGTPTGQPAAPSPVAPAAGR